MNFLPLPFTNHFDMIAANRSKLISSLSPEQRMLISVCAPKSSAGRDEARSLILKPFSWEQLIQLSERHRLILMLYKNIKVDSLFPPFELPPSLKEKYLNQTQHVLKLATEGVRISSKISGEGISSILLKGPFLSQQIYNDVALRPSRDIDILVTPENVESVNDILVGEGYRLVYPDFKLSKKQNDYYQKYKNQFAYRNPENGCLIELHWRLFGQRSLFPVPTEKVFEESQEFTMAGKTIRLLSKNHCFEYLCLHGSLHQWFRLHWLRDIAQLLMDEKENLQEMVVKAKRNGNDRPVEQAIILANLFFGSPGFETNYGVKRAVKSLVNQSVSAATSDESKTLSHKIDRLRIPFYKMKLKRSIPYKLSSWSVLQPNFSDWKRVKLPDSLFIFYFVLRPFVWFYSTYMSKDK